MIDDLTTQGVSEPYRMFTSRAEYRLSLRADNADERLTGKGVALGCVGLERAGQYRDRRHALEAARALLKSCSATPQALEAFGVSVNKDGLRRSAFDLAAQPQHDIASLARVWPELATIEPALASRLEADAKYSVYLDRQAEDVERYRREDSLALPADIDYARLSGLSNELRQKFETARPRSIGQAGRIEGVTPAALALVAAHARRPSRRAGSAS
jgi:tRNA uridine 5-carboxymethylaminomethyl modification enzyme